MRGKGKGGGEGERGKGKGERGKGKGERGKGKGERGKGKGERGKEKGKGERGEGRGERGKGKGERGKGKGERGKGKGERGKGKGERERGEEKGKGERGKGKGERGKEKGKSGRKTNVVPSFKWTKARVSFSAILPLLTHPPTTTSLSMCSFPEPSLKRVESNTLLSKALLEYLNSIDSAAMMKKFSKKKRKGFFFFQTQEKKPRPLPLTTNARQKKKIRRIDSLQSHTKNICNWNPLLNSHVINKNIPVTSKRGSRPMMGHVPLHYFLMLILIFVLILK